MPACVLHCFSLVIFRFGPCSFLQPGSSGFSAPSSAGGTDGGRFGARAGQGAAAQYGGAYASVYGAQQVVSCN
jgi:hypothetical protein